MNTLNWFITRAYPSDQRDTFRRLLKAHASKRKSRRSNVCKILVFSVMVLFNAPSAFAQADQPVKQGKPNVPEFEPAFPEQTRAPASNSDVTLAVETFAETLEHPWGIDILPNGSYLVTERPGRMRVISENGELSEPVKGIPEVLAQKQGGLLDVKIGPNFSEDRMIYWAYSKLLDNGQSVDRRGMRTTLR